MEVTCGEESTTGQVSSVLSASITFPVGDEPFGKGQLRFCAELFQLTPQRAEKRLFYKVTLKLQICELTH